MDAMTKIEKISKPKYDEVSIPKGIACSVLIGAETPNSLKIYSDVKRAVNSNSKINGLDTSAKSAKRNEQQAKAEYKGLQIATELLTLPIDVDAIESDYRVSRLFISEEIQNVHSRTPEF